MAEATGGRAEGWTGGRSACLLTLLLLGVSVAPAAFAQVPDSARADTTRQIAPADTIDPTGILLQSQEDSKVVLRSFPRTGREQLLPVGGRIVIPRDSIDYRNAETVSVILATIDGVYIWRGGWIGRAEQTNYQGRGSTSVEYLLDGIPLLAAMDDPEPEVPAHQGPTRTSYQQEYQQVDAAAEYNTKYEQELYKRWSTGREYRLLSRLLASQPRCRTLLELPCGGGRPAVPIGGGGRDEVGDFELRLAGDAS